MGRKSKFKLEERLFMCKDYLQSIYYLILYKKIRSNSSNYWF